MVIFNSYVKLPEGNLHHLDWLKEPPKRKYNIFPCHGCGTRNQHHRLFKQIQDYLSMLIITSKYPMHKHLLDCSSTFWKMLDFFIQDSSSWFIPFLQQSWINPHECPIQLIIINGDYYCPFINGLMGVQWYTLFLLSIYSWINPVIIIRDNTGIILD